MSGRFRVFALLLAVALVLGACGDDDGATTTTGAAAETEVELVLAHSYQESQPQVVCGANVIKEVAEAEKFQKLTVAEGEGQAIERVFSAIHTGDPTPDLIAIRYLEALQGIADGKASKLFLPMEFSGILSALGAVKEVFDGDQSA